MKCDRSENEERTIHHLQCPDCPRWFDMRDLGAVMEQKLEKVICSHVQQVGNEREFFIKTKKGIVALRYKSKRGPYPEHRA